MGPEAGEGVVEVERAQVERARPKSMRLGLGGRDAVTWWPWSGGLRLPSLASASPLPRCAFSLDSAPHQPCNRLKAVVPNFPEQPLGRDFHSSPGRPRALHSSESGV